MNHVFISGPTGCIGAATLAYLLDHGVEHVVGFSRRRDWSRIDERYRDRVTLLTGDITNGEQVRQAIHNHRPTHIIHLAAFQTPDCQANPLTGLDVNVVGTINMFRAASELKDRLLRFVFASSAAVYGPRTLYPGDKVAADSPYLPPNLYGYWKVAGEGAAQAFHRETGIATVSLRLATTYGPGRDKGLTAAPTTALKAAALGVAYRMPYQGREHYHYVSDVGAGFALAATDDFAGYGAFNLPGATFEVADFVDLIKQAAADRGIRGAENLGIASDAAIQPFVCDLTETEILGAFPSMPLTPLRSGIDQSLETFQRMVASGQLSSNDLASGADA